MAKDTEKKEDTEVVEKIVKGKDEIALERIVSGEKASDVLTDLGLTKRDMKLFVKEHKATLRQARPKPKTREIDYDQAISRLREKQEKLQRRIDRYEEEKLKKAETKAAKEAKDSDE